jgi:hypothetical protein
MATRTRAVADEQNISGEAVDTEHRPLLIDIPGVQAELGDTSRTTVYELIKRGDLVKVNIGRRSFVTSKSLAAYVERLSAAVTA